MGFNETDSSRDRTLYLADIVQRDIKVVFYGWILLFVLPRASVRTHVEGLGPARNFRVGIHRGSTCWGWDLHE